MAIYLCERCGFWSRERSQIFVHFEAAHCGEPPIRVEDFGVLPGPLQNWSRSQWEAERFASALYPSSIPGRLPAGSYRPHEAPPKSGSPVKSDPPVAHTPRPGACDAASAKI